MHKAVGHSCGSPPVALIPNSVRQDSSAIRETKIHHLHTTSPFELLTVGGGQNYRG